jgi:hypothetical protein
MNIKEQLELNLITGATLENTNPLKGFRGQPGPELIYPVDNALPVLDKAHFNIKLPLLVATKHDSGKADWSLVPFEALEDMVKVLEFGANKYSRNNWRENGGFKWLRICNSTLRHLFAFMRGETLDPESGISHIAHAQCNLLFLAYYIQNSKSFKANDDR